MSKLNKLKISVKRKTLKRVLLTVAVMAVCLILPGCEEARQATLEDIASSDTSLTKTITEKIETPAGTTAEVTFSGDSFDLTYTFDDAMDEEYLERMSAAFDANASGLKENCESAISDLSQQTSISGITGTIHIVNADGNEIWSCRYPQ